MKACGRLSAVHDLQSAQDPNFDTSFSVVSNFNAVNSRDDTVVVGQKSIGLFPNRLAKIRIDRLSSAQSQKCTHIEFKKPRSILFVDVCQERARQSGNVSIIALGGGRYFQAGIV